MSAVFVSIFLYMIQFFNAVCYECTFSRFVKQLCPRFSRVWRTEILSRCRPLSSCQTAVCSEHTSGPGRWHGPEGHPGHLGSDWQKCRVQTGSLTSLKSTDMSLNDSPSVLRWQDSGRLAFCFPFNCCRWRVLSSAPTQIISSRLLFRWKTYRKPSVRWIASTDTKLAARRSWSHLPQELLINHSLYWGKTNKPFISGLEAIL